MDTVDNELSYEERKAIRERKSNQAVKESLDTIFHELNYMGQEEDVSKAVVDTVLHEHRTLQQKFFRSVIVPIILDFAKRYDDGQYDLRNEDSCKCAKKLEPLLKDVHFRFV